MNLSIIGLVGRRSRMLKLMVGGSVIITAVFWMVYSTRTSQRSSAVVIDPDMEITVITRPKAIRDIFLHKPAFRTDVSSLRIVNTEAMLRYPGSTCRYTDYAGVTMCQAKGGITNNKYQWTLLKQLLETDRELNLIDFNTGSGLLTVATAKLGRHVLGIDSSYDNILLLSESIRVNDVTDKIQLIHSNIAQSDHAESTPRVDPDMITNEILFQKAVIKVSIDLGYDDQFRTSLVNLLRRLDIPFIISVGANEAQCELLNGLLSSIDLDYKIVDRNMKYNPSGCMDSAVVWLKQKNKSPQPVPKDVRILNPNEVQSIVNYVKCIGLAKRIYICVSTKDTTIAPEIQKLGYWKPHLWNSIEKMMDDRQDLGFIDIGAHIGEFTLLALAKGRRVLAVEGVYENIQRLCESIRVNRLNQTNLKLIHTAVSDQYKYLVIHGNDPTEVNQLSSQTGDTAKSGYLPNSVIKTIRFDDLTPLAPRSAILRLDMKWLELPALQRIDVLLKTVDVVAIFMERIIKSIGSDWENAVDLLTKSGYRAHVIENGMTTRFVHVGQNEWPQEMVWLKDRESN